MAEIKKLKQMGSLQEYVKNFEVLMDKAQLGEGQALSCFLAGLKHDMEIMVRMFNPKTLQEASLAKLQKALKNEPGRVNYTRVKWIPNKPVGGSRNLHFSKLNSSGGNGVNIGANKATSLPVIGKRPLNLTPRQMEEKIVKNQCFWCDERFVPGHKCKNRQLYTISVQKEEELNEVMTDEGMMKEVLDLGESNP